MTSGHRILWSQLTIGVLVTLFFTVVSVSIFFIDRVRDSIEDRYTLYFNTFTLQTIQPRAPVWLAGQPVGHVADLEFLPPMIGARERLRVVLSLSASAQPFITEGAAAQVITSGLLGEAVVNILPADEPGAPLGHRSELPTARGLDPFEVTRRLQTAYDSVQPVVDRWREVFRQIRSGRGTLPRSIQRPEETLELHRNLNRLAATIDTLGIAAERFSRFANAQEVRHALGNLGPRFHQLATEWLESEGTVSGLAGDSVLAGHVDGVISALERMRNRIETGHGTLGRLLNDQVLSQELERTHDLIRELRTELSPMRRHSLPH